MAIHGDIVGTPMRPADWDEKNPENADHIRGNKPGLTQTPEGISAGSDLLMNDHKVKNLANPSDAKDAATKEYVDSAASGANSHADAKFSEAQENTNSKFSDAKSYADDRHTDNRQYIDQKSIDDRSYAEDVAASKSNAAWKQMQVTLSASGWNGLDYEAAVEGLQEDSIVFAEPDANSKENLRLYRESDIWAYKQTTGKLFFYAYEGRPSADVKVNIAFKVGV